MFKMSLATVTKVNRLIQIHFESSSRLVQDLDSEAVFLLMDSSVKILSRRERRRRLNEGKCESEDNEDIVIKQNINAEERTKKSSRILVRRDTFTVSKPKAIFTDSLSDEMGEDGNSPDGSEFNIVPQSDSDNSRNLTHTIKADDWLINSKNQTYSLSNNDTYSVKRIEPDNGIVRPVPAPRRRETVVVKESDKNSSDTDKDVMDIDIDEAVLSNHTESLEKGDKVFGYESDTSVEVPKPKPRKLSSMSIVQCSHPKTDSISKSKSLEEITVKVVSPRSIKSNPETKSVICDEHVKEFPKPDVLAAVERQRKQTGKFSDLLHRRKQKKQSKMLPSVMRLEKTRIPAISSILREFKEDTTKTKLEEDKEEDRIDFQIESPRLPQSAPNEKVYVQYKNGFYMRNKEDVLKQEQGFSAEKGKMESSMSSSMLKTALQFQKYWSRSMLYFHGVLAGFGFGHVFAVTSVLFYFNHEIQDFVDIYACLALKIHFVFYTFTALSIISCLDRLDFGNLSKKHWRHICSKCPSLWFIMIMYSASFILTLVNQRTESRFDSYQYENVTGERLWDAEFNKDVQQTFYSWYRIVWARDVLVLAAWLLISITEYPDKLYFYVSDLSTRMDERTINDETKITVIP